MCTYATPQGRATLRATAAVSVSKTKKKKKTGTNSKMIFTQFYDKQLEDEL